MLDSGTAGSSARVKPSQGWHLLFSCLAANVCWSLLLAPCFNDPWSRRRAAMCLAGTWVSAQNWKIYFLLDNALCPILYSLRKTLEATRQFKSNERASWERSAQEVCLEDSSSQLPLEKPQWVGSRWLSSANTPKSPKTPDYWGNEVLARWLHLRCSWAWLSFSPARQNRILIIERKFCSENMQKWGLQRRWMFANSSGILDLG